MSHFILSLFRTNLLTEVYSSLSFSSLDQYGTTALIWAARKGHYDCVTHLLENGANVDQEGAVCVLIGPPRHDYFSDVY